MVCLHNDKMAKDLITCKKCGEEKPKETSFTKKENQVTCNECLEKAKSRRATSTVDKLNALEKQINELKEKLDKEMQEKQYYQSKFESFADKYSSLCIKIGELKFIDDIKKTQKTQSDEISKLKKLVESK